ncbi:MAG TPA: hypothetical protein VLG37_01380 [Candidatus Saccharimonadales bacterium]|nr:hypothetical protein [Candidatus Saccharimonadales bacterium]
MTETLVRAPEPETGVTIADQIAYFFNLETGQILTDSSAVIASIEAGEAPRHLQQLFAAGKLVVDPEVRFSSEKDNESKIRKLGELLCDKTVKIDKGRYEPLDVIEWDMVDYLSYGHWLLSVASTINVNVVRRAYRLGLGPSIGQFQGRKNSCFRSLTKYYEALGTNLKNQRGLYKSWDLERVVNYTEVVNQHKPSTQTLMETLAERARSGQGPSYETILTLTGQKPGALLGDKANQPFRYRSNDDLVRLGVEYMLNHDGNVPKTSVIIELAHDNLAPSATTLRRRFGTISNFHRELRSVYYLTLRLINKLPEEREQKLASIIKSLPPQSLLPHLIQRKDRPLSYETCLRVLAQYKLINALLVDARVSQERKDQLASIAEPSRFIAMMTKPSMGLDEKTIRRTAERIGVAEFIWPSEE